MLEIISNINDSNADPKVTCSEKRTSKLAPVTGLNPRDKCLKNNGALKEHPPNQTSVHRQNYGGCDESQTRTILFDKEESFHLDDAAVLGARFERANSAS